MSKSKTPKEIHDAQLDEELGFSSSEDSEEQLSRLAKAADKANERIIGEMSEAVSAQELKLKAATAEAELAQEIAEDEALAAAEAEAATMDQVSDRELDEEIKAALPGEDQYGNPDMRALQSCIEALLFMSERPLPAKKIREYVGYEFSPKLIQEAIASMKERYGREVHGIELKEIAGGYQLRTKAERAPLARLLSKTLPHKLSRGAMETLAIIAYKQPVMKDEVDKIRGVDTSHFIRGLMDKKLIAMTGRSELPGRPMLYGTTTEFLEVFGLNSADDLPPLRELESMIPSSEVGDDEEDPKIIQLRKLVHEMNENRENLVYNPSEDDQILNDFREQVKSIAVSTPYLDEQAELEKSEKLAAAEAKKKALEEKLQPELDDLKARQEEEATEPEAVAAEADTETETETEIEIEVSSQTEVTREAVAENQSESSMSASSPGKASASSSEELRRAAALVKSGDV